MQSVTHKELAVVEKKIAALNMLGKKMEKMEKKLAGLVKRVDSPKNRRNAVGTLTDTAVSREADALGRDFRRKLTKP